MGNPDLFINIETRHHGDFNFVVEGKDYEDEGQAITLAMEDYKKRLVSEREWDKNFGTPQIKSLNIFTV